MQLQGACSSAGRAPALQVSRLNHISAASGVAYTETRGATTLSNWTDVGPKALLRSLGQRRRARCVASRRRNVRAALEPALTGFVSGTVRRKNIQSSVG